MGNRKIDRRSFFLTAAMVGALSVAALPLRAEDCAPGRVTITGDFGKASFGVEIADTNASRARGLMHVEHLPLSQGMLFVYDSPQVLSFWMRNTLIELDILFLDEAGVIRHIHPRAKPLDETVISPPEAAPLRGVLEINGGLATRLGIAEGDVLHHPAFGTDAPGGGCAGSE